MSPCTMVRGATSLWNKWFPYEQVPCSPQLIPCKVTVTKDEVYNWCACGESTTQPWCDCSSNECLSRGYHPIVYISTQCPELMCGCIHGGMKPLCDGTCAMLWADNNLLPPSESLDALAGTGMPNTYQCGFAAKRDSCAYVGSSSRFLVGPRDV